MATVAPSATLAQSQAYLDAHLISTPTAPPTSARSISTSTQFQAQANPFIQTATLTTNAFPSFEPTGFATYPSTHLLLPLRKDILHRAVIYEGDMTRQGTASTKYRSEVHGSNRKIRPQKGTGKARLGNKKSPMLRGGGVAFGPHPRDFSTGLQRKVAERYLKDLLKYNRMGHEHGRTLFVTRNIREGLYTALEGEHMGKEARAKDCADVDVKDLLELGRVVMERSALEYILGQHEEDLAPGEKLHAWSRVARRAAYEERTRAGHKVDALPMAA
ncbi:54S ribosomal protein yml6, mitochondrial [Rachicladosporium monterosium]|uniref:Large ribosomal subunit protein uL4m n=1 Tax=Rachicladosporium monterosium TaxID=1507873 RepID=A0ABR0L8S5_9PEZI|nr:54S ribosomal protein yml6, mitochondrial [Rachicladosporium monterosium]